MLLAKIMLTLTSLTWICYGGWLFVDPTGLRYAGYELNNWAAIVEVQAMYGLAEVALGVFALIGLLRPAQYMRPALLLWFMIYTSLVIGRIVGIIMWDGTFSIFPIGAEGLPDSYNAGAMYFLEIPSAILLLIALRKTSDNGSII